MSNTSKIFAGFRALGLTNNHIPITVRYNRKHKEHYAVTCVGKAFHIYNVSTKVDKHCCTTLPVVIHNLYTIGK